MANIVTLECPKCGRRKQDERRDTDYHDTALVRLICPDCDDGDFHEEQHFDASGNHINRDPSEGLTVADLRLEMKRLSARLDKVLGCYADSMPKEAYHEVNAVMRALAAQPAPAGEVDEDDEFGNPPGYSDWYNAHFYGQPVNTHRDHACEAAWRAALKHSGRDARAAAAASRPATAVPEGYAKIPEMIDAAPPHYLPSEAGAYVAGWNWCVSAMQVQAPMLSAAPQPAAKPNAWPDTGPYEGPVRLDEAIAWMVDAIRDGEGHAEVIRRAKCVKAALRSQPEAKAGADEPHADMIEAAALYGWQHEAWTWESVRAGLDRFREAKPAPVGGGVDADEVLIAIKRGEGYEDVHPQLVAEDALRQTLYGGCQFEWRVVEAAPAPAGEAVAKVMPHLWCSHRGCIAAATGDSDECAAYCCKLSSGDPDAEKRATDVNNACRRLAGKEAPRG